MKCCANLCSFLYKKTLVDVYQLTAKSKYINKPSDFFDYYGLLEYRYMGEYKKSKMTKINVNYETENYSYLEVPGELMYANKIDMIILIRGVKYTINLK